MLTWDAIIDGLGGTRVVAASLEQLDSVVSGWRTRGIPAAHWSAIVRLAAERECEGVDLEALAVLAARKPKPAKPNEARP